MDEGRTQVSVREAVQCIGMINDVRGVTTGCG